MEAAGHRKQRRSSHNADALEHHIAITFPDWRMLRLASRSALLTLAILSFLWIGRIGHDAAVMTAPVARSVSSKAQIDDVFFLPMLFRDLKRRGVFGRRTDRALVVGSGASLRLPFLRREGMSLVDSLKGSGPIPDESFDLVIASDGIHDANTAVFVDRVLKTGGVAVTRLSNDPSSALHVPSNYRPVYVRRFGSTIVAMRKIGGTRGAGFGWRKLLVVEPPRASSTCGSSWGWRGTR